MPASRSDARDRSAPLDRSARGYARVAYARGALAGSVAGLVMALFMMSVQVLRGQSVWTNPDLIAAMWMGPSVANGELTAATPVGFATHMATSALMGVVAVPFIADRRRGRTLLASVSYALASYPLVFAAVLSWANPLMVARTDLVPMTMGHAVFGLVMGVVYLRGERRRHVEAT